MKTNQLSSSIGRSFLQKLFMSFLSIALLFGALPVHSAFAAPAGAGSPAAKDFEQEWGDKIYWVRLYGSFYERVRVYPANYENLNELAKAHDILNKYGVALRGAQTVIAGRAGFDAKGRVVNDALADKSLKELSSYIQTMRILRGKLDGLDGKYILLPAGSTTVTSQ